MISLPQLPPLPPLPQVHTPVLEETLPQERGVQQHVNVYTSTGGSVVTSGGTVQDGKSTSHVEVQTIINGEKVVDINRTEVATGSSAVEVVGIGTTSQVHINTGSSTSVKEKGLFKRFISYVFSFFPF